MAQVVEDPIAAAPPQAGATGRSVRPPLDRRRLAVRRGPRAARRRRLLERAARRVACPEARLQSVPRRGNNVHAGGIAIRLALDYLGRVRAPSSAAGRRAASGCSPMGRRRGARAGGARPRGRRAGAGSSTNVFEQAEARLRDRQALRQPRSPSSPSSQGSALVYLGELDRGLALLDEASTSALIGELDPFSSTVVYCVTIVRARRASATSSAQRQWTGPPASGATSRTRTAFRERAASTAPRSSGSAASGRRRARGGQRVRRASSHTTRSPPAPATTRSARSTAGGATSPKRRRRTARRTSSGESRSPDRRCCASRGQGRRGGRGAPPLARRRGAGSRHPRSAPAGPDRGVAGHRRSRERKISAEELEEITERFRVGGERTPLLDSALQISLARIAAAEDDWAASGLPPERARRLLDARRRALREERRRG